MTNDPDRGNRGDSRIVTFPHAPGAHVCAAAPNFAFRSIKYDTSYVGTLSFPVRLTMAESVRRQQHLRYFLQHPNTLDWQDPQSSYLHMNDQEKKRALERLYVEKMAQSWTTLCPRGMGSVSIRFFETLCAWAAFPCIFPTPISCLGRRRSITPPSACCCPSRRPNTPAKFWTSGSPAKAWRNGRPCA